MFSRKLRTLAKEWSLQVPGHIRNVHEKPEVWTKKSIRILEASAKPTGDGFPGLIAHGHPLDQKYPCSITRLPYDNDAVGTCQRLMELENPLFLRFKDVLKDVDLLAIQEAPGISFEAYFKIHVKDFLVGLQGDVFLTVSPLCQRLFRELITASYHLKKMNLPFVPNVASTPLHIGPGGSVSIKVNPLLCEPPECVISVPPAPVVSVPLAPVVLVPRPPVVSVPPALVVSEPNQLRFGDPLVGHCAEEMGQLLDPYLDLAELDDLKSKAVNGQWWEDLGDLFLHPFFWTPQMHESFLNNMDILMFRPHGTSSKIHSLRLLADTLQTEWQLQPTSWGGPWVAHCPFEVPADWANYTDHKDTLVRQVRNWIHHPRSSGHFAVSRQWDYRRDLFIHFMNKSHAISPNLFHAYWSVKQCFKTTQKYKGLDTTMWESALSSVLPKGM